MTPAARLAPSVPDREADRPGTSAKFSNRGYSAWKLSVFVPLVQVKPSIVFQTGLPLASADEFDDPNSHPQTSQRKFVLSRASKTTGCGDNDAPWRGRR